MTLKVTRTAQRTTIRATGADAARLMNALATRGSRESLESIVSGLNPVPKRPNSQMQASGADEASSGSIASLLGAA